MFWCVKEMSHRSFFYHTLQGDKMQRHDKIHQKCTRRKQVKSEFLFYCRDIDGKCSKIMKEPLCTFDSPESVLPDSWQPIKGAKIAFF